MKKSIIVGTLLVFVFIWLILINVAYWDNVSFLINEVEAFQKYYNADNFASFDNTLQGLKDSLNHNLVYAIFSLLAALATLAAIIIIAIKDFPVFKPLLDKLNAKRDARKQAKAEKAEADKQARIEQLQAELDELKKNE